MYCRCNAIEIKNKRRFILYIVINILQKVEYLLFFFSNFLQRCTKKRLYAKLDASTMLCACAFTLTTCIYVFYAYYTKPFPQCFCFHISFSFLCVGFVLILDFNQTKTSYIETQTMNNFILSALFFLSYVNAASNLLGIFYKRIYRLYFCTQ